MSPSSTVRRPRPWSALIVGAAALALWMVERRQPLRRRVEPAPPRQLRNLIVGVIGALTVRAVEEPIVTAVARLAARRRWGLLRFRLPRPLEDVLALLLLDYTLFLWHVLVHRTPWLWRFHRVHHVDLDLDASTAIRFHFGELAISTPWRATQVALIGVRPELLRHWQRLTLLSILFHHSNLRLPGRLEWLLSCVVVTPRLHGIHHSNRADEMEANWSSGLTIWDRLHGTLRSDVQEEALTIGVDGVAEPDQVSLPRILVMPFERTQEPVRVGPSASA